MNESGPPHRRQTGIRTRVAAATAALLAVLLTAGIILFANLVTNSLGRDLDASLTTQTNVVVDALAAEGPGALVGIDADDANIIQFVGPSGDLVYTSDPNAIGHPLTAVRPPAGTREIEGIRTWWAPWDGRPPLAVQATGFAYAGSTYTLVVATSQDRTLQAVNSMAAGLGVATPILITLGAVLSRGLVTRSLRPIDNIRRRVEAVSASNLSERVGVVPTGDEIEALAHTMNRMLSRLEEAQNSQRQFIADASHELRSPIAALHGALEIAARTGRIDTWTEMAPLLQTETLRLSELVGDLLLLSRIDDHGVGLDVGDVDLDDVALTEAAALQSPGRADGEHRPDAGPNPGRPGKAPPCGPQPRRQRRPSCRRPGVVPGA